MIPELRAILVEDSLYSFPTGMTFARQVDHHTLPGKMPRSTYSPKTTPPPREFGPLIRGLKNHVVSHETLISGGEVVGVG